jgi:hypothetical protein
MHSMLAAVLVLLPMSLEYDLPANHFWLMLTVVFTLSLRTR